MSYHAEQDPLCYPGTSVLINKAELRSQADLDEFEFLMHLTRAEEPLPAGNLDYAHYKAIHRHLFQDVYEWAGEPRTIRIAKGGNWFCYPEHLEWHMARTFSNLSKANFLISLNDTDFAEKAAETISEINAGHPFREGNGRTQLAFLKLLVTRSGLPFHDDVLTPDRTLDAMIESFLGNIGPLRDLIVDLVA